MTDDATPKPYRGLLSALDDELMALAANDAELICELAALVLVSGRASVDSLERLRTLWRDADDRGRAYLRRRMAET